MKPAKLSDVKEALLTRDDPMYKKVGEPSAPMTEVAALILKDLKSKRRGFTRQPETDASRAEAKARRKTERARKTAARRQARR